MDTCNIRRINHHLVPIHARAGQLPTFVCADRCRRHSARARYRLRMERKELPFPTLLRLAICTGIVVRLQKSERKRGTTGSNEADVCQHLHDAINAPTTCPPAVCHSFVP
eukprot:COSAG02_NODE_1043_length_15014_cov_8.766007_4_plen_110_part_00